MLKKLVTNCHSVTKLFTIWMAISYSRHGLNNGLLDEWTVLDHLNTKIVRSCIVLNFILLAVLDYFTGLKLAFVVTKFRQKVWVKGITNWYLFVYMAARLLYIDMVAAHRAAHKGDNP